MVPTWSLIIVLPGTYHAWKYHYGIGITYIILMSTHLSENPVGLHKHLYKFYMTSHDIKERKRIGQPIKDACADDQGVICRSNRTLSRRVACVV